jgi:hypothetical protein
MYIGGNEISKQVDFFELEAKNRVTAGDFDTAQWCIQAANAAFQAYVCICKRERAEEKQPTTAQACQPEEAGHTNSQQLKSEIAALVAECSANAINSGNNKYQWLIDRLRQLSAV